MKPADVHPEDEAARVAIRDRLIAARHNAGWSQLTVARKLGIRQGVVAEWERVAGARTRIRTIQRRARLHGWRLRMTFPGLPDVEDGDVVTFRNLADSHGDPDVADRWHRAATAAYLRAARRHLGLGADDVAIVLDRTESAVFQVESGSDDPSLATYQRYTRALGGRLDLALEPVPSHAPEGVPA